MTNLQNKASFRFWTEDVVRFADLDPLNHVNNVTSAVYCEAGRADFVTNLWPDCINGKGLSWMLASLNLTFLAPVYYPAKIMIGTNVNRVGNSSVTIGQGLFSGDKCFTTAESVMVWADLDSESSVPLNEEMKALLSSYCVGG